MDEAPPKRRRALRITGYDYSQPANYFVTICTQGKKQIFGKVGNQQMHLTAAGQGVQTVWFDLPKRFPSVIPRELVVMPNHIHAIIGLTRPIQPPRKAGAASSAPTTEPLAASLPTLGQIVRRFKSLSAIEVNRILERKRAAVWQRNYYEHIVRGVEEFQRIRRYILENPLHWDDDPENVLL
jgi:putative transposase